MRKLFLLLLLPLTSCVSLDTVVSDTKTTNAIIEYRYYDSKSDIRYHITNDKENLYIKLNTIEPASIMKIFKTGLTVYFYTKGQKNKNRYIQ